MEQQFDVILTGSDSQIEGIASAIAYPGYIEAYDFNSFDGTLHLAIAKETDGNWIRIAGSEPYFAGWVDELVEQINNPATSNSVIIPDNE